LAESSNHAFLVNSIIDWIKLTQDNETFVILSDTFTQGAREIPTAINGYIPDVYAVNVKKNKYIIGEAKTYTDVETRHSCEQYKAFLKYCADNSNTFFVLAVPWTMINAAKSLFRYLKRTTNTHNAKVIFIEDLPE
jgi:hypothetical protein